ncbi:MAG: HEPN domain-containing protein [Myxococcota bacterium]
MSRHADWLAQGHNDIEWAEHSLLGGFYSQTCFIAQQAAEKFLKALCYYRELDVVKTHSLFKIVEALGINGSMLERAKRLDLYYIPARYPDAFPAGAPFEMFSQEQAQVAIEDASAIAKCVVEELRE